MKIIAKGLAFVGISFQIHVKVCNHIPLSLKHILYHNSR